MESEKTLSVADLRAYFEKRAANCESAMEFHRRQAGEGLSDHDRRVLFALQVRRNLYQELIMSIDTNTLPE